MSLYGRKKARRGLLLLLVLSLLLTLAVPVSVGAAAIEAPDANAYFTESETLFQDYAPGILRPDQGTIQLTMRIDKDFEQFGNDWDYVFKVSPTKEIGNTLMGIYVPARPERGLAFILRDGVNTQKALDTTFTYTPGQRINVAITWGTELRLYVNGVLKQSAPMAGPIRSDLLPYRFEVDKSEPFHTEALKISTRALSAAELTVSPGIVFTGDADTSLLAVNGLKEIEHRRTNWHRTIGYHSLTPVGRPEKSVFTEGAPVITPFVALNMSDSSKSYQVKIKANNADGEPVMEKEITVLSQSDRRYHIHEIALPELAGRGYYNLQTTVSYEGQLLTTWDTGIAVLPANDASSPDGQLADYYGTYLLDDFDPAILKGMNVKTTRSPFRWRIVEPVKGAFDWEKTDAYVAKAREAGMDILGTLGYLPQWAGIPSPPEIQAKSDLAKRPERWLPRDLQEWANYVYQTVSRYKDDVKVWEIYNEVNFHPPADPSAFPGSTELYAQMLRIAYQEAKRADPDALISTSGFSDSDAADSQMPLQLLEDQYAEGYFDVFNLHAYGGTAKTDIWIDKLKEKRPGVPYWMSEHMWYTLFNKKAREFKTIEWFAMFLERGYDRFINMGLMDVFFSRFTMTPNADFQVVAAFQNQIRKADRYLGKYTFAASDNFTIRHYFRRADGTYLSMLGSAIGEYAIEASGGIMQVTDIYGQTVPVTTENGKTVFRVKSTAYIISSQPLELTKTTLLGEVPLHTNESFEEVLGDPAMGLQGVIPTGWIFRDKLNPNDTQAKIILSQTARTGNYSMELTSGGGGRVYVFEDTELHKPGKYRLTAYFKRLAGDSSLKAYTFFYDRSPSVNNTKDGYLADISDTEFVPLIFDFEVPVTPTVKQSIGFGIYSGAGKVLLDDISLTYVGEIGSVVVPNQIVDAKKEYLDLTTAMNQTYTDETAGDGQGGWADLGTDNLGATDFKTGKRAVGGVPFDIKDRSAPVSVATLGGVIRPNIPARIKGIPVGKALAKVGFLYTAMYVDAAKGAKLGEFILHYDDGTTATHELLNKVNINDWYVPGIDPAVPIGEKVITHATGERALFVSVFDNPQPNKIIQSIDIVSNKNSILFILAATGEKP
ncbi:hypothetical protein BC351_29500 [Paenibacillus ferrarius]|uniref:GH10 domain-containing protein n=1 Tax=Paenibacillus ferrarius TaxID=1469647 RepID=A0A1V4HHJ0_9BACL|nr:endo-1,4-beta-xylanase [Paenibacillus ferrarius]OPH56026.1 hypothetical protein BC351_29500 [Paenibacillus ferrarius]